MGCDRQRLVEAIARRYITASVWQPHNFDIDQVFRQTGFDKYESMFAYIA